MNPDTVTATNLHQKIDQLTTWFKDTGHAPDARLAAIKALQAEIHAMLDTLVTKKVAP